jgi:hypothetical protein
MAADSVIKPSGITKGPTVEGKALRVFWALILKSTVASDTASDTAFYAGSDIAVVAPEAETRQSNESSNVFCTHDI